MEQEPPPIGHPVFRVLWHSATKRDLAKLPPSLVESIVRASDHRLARAPHLIGEPLKGSVSRLWKLRFSQYRIIYTIHPQRHEVWVLSVQKRDVVYRDRHVPSLLNLAVALHQELDRPRSH